ncbi:cell division protein FtsX [Candidatus Coxiella mudrowiae]|uniref:cell division protein FtsX n=1 Tax=Candidatus Coxiella mudrowiae TaxID=2054173 RepID=UPI000A6091D0|nr:FtsX-like permease family protein [Candidatus Coxiella mudrowiae]
MDLKSFALVDTEQFDLTWVKRLHYFVVLGQRIIDTLAILFGIGIILIIGNTIRLTTESHHQEIIILKLVGTTPSFIRRLLPYPGFFYSLSGGFLAWLNCYSLMLWAVASNVEHLAATYNNHFLIISGASVQVGFEILFFSIFMGLCGSWLAIYRQEPVFKFASRLTIPKRSLHLAKKPIP